jgi:hypothetical protein
VLFSPEILKRDDPVFEEDDASGERREVPKSEIRELFACHMPLLSILTDMDSGLIRCTMSEYDNLSHKFMHAWLLFKAQKAEKVESERQRNSVSPHA